MNERDSLTTWVVARRTTLATFCRPFIAAFHCVASRARCIGRGAMYVKESTKQKLSIFTPQVPCAVDDKCGLPTAVHKAVKGLTRCECLCLARNLQGSQGTLARMAWAFPLRIDHFNAEDKLLGNCWSVEEPWRSLQSHGKRVSPVRYPDEEVRD